MKCYNDEDMGFGLEAGTGSRTAPGKWQPMLSRRPKKASDCTWFMLCDKVSEKLGVLVVPTRDRQRMKCFQQREFVSRRCAIMSLGKVNLNAMSLWGS
jgi:hypothetical protein